MENGRKNWHYPFERAKWLRFAGNIKALRLLLSCKLLLSALVIFQDSATVVAVGGSYFRPSPAPAGRSSAAAHKLSIGGDSSGGAGRVSEG